MAPTSWLTRGTRERADARAAPRRRDDDEASDGRWTMDAGRKVRERVVRDRVARDVREDWGGGGGEGDRLRAVE